jgi:site-specific recombinase XerD
MDLESGNKDDRFRPIIAFYITGYPILIGEQIETILNAIGHGSSQEVKYRCIVLLLLDNGMRISELLSIKNDYLDLMSGFITVLGKGQKQRVVPIS